jgi:hypothetical protein
MLLNHVHPVVKKHVSSSIENKNRMNDHIPVLTLLS